MVIIVVAIIAIAIIGHTYGFSHRYIVILSSTWEIFAGWFPVVIIILGIITSNSDKKFIKIISEHGQAAWLINNVATCAISILFTAVSLFFYCIFIPPPLWATVGCSVAAMFTVYILTRVSIQIFVAAKNIVKVESRQDPEKK